MTANAQYEVIGHDSAAHVGGRKIVRQLFGPWTYKGHVVASVKIIREASFTGEIGGIYEGELSVDVSELETIDRQHGDGTIVGPFTVVYRENGTESWFELTGRNYQYATAAEAVMAAAELVIAGLN